MSFPHERARLASLLQRGRTLEALDVLTGRVNSVLAVPEPARAFVLASASYDHKAKTLLAVVPTHGEAERLTADLRAFLDSESVEMFPAWETLPFERVSPGIETMGVRSRVRWRMRSAATRPAIVVAPVKALLQQLAPWTDSLEPLIVHAGDKVDLDELVVRLVGMGYRREYQVEHRGEFAVRGSILDVFPSTEDAPVRIDTWGDDVDRLSEFSIADQRSSDDVPEVVVHAAREVVPGEEARRRVGKLVATAPWGREQWERIAEGQVFDGIESWLPWIADETELLTDSIGDGDLVALCEPRRLRDRAEDLLADEESLAGALAGTWGAGDVESVPRLHAAFDRLLSRATAPVWSVAPVPDSPNAAVVNASGWGGGGGDPELIVKRVQALAGEGVQVVVCADGAGSAERMSASFAEHGLLVAVVDEPPLLVAQKRNVDNSIAPVIVVQSVERGFVLPDVGLAVLSEGDVTGRRRAHRPASARRAKNSETFYDDLKSGDHVVHHVHGVAKYVGMVKRSIAGVERDYLLLEYRGDDKLYVPSDQVDAIRPYSGGESPTLSKFGGSDWAKTKARVRSAAQEVAQELVVLYQRRMVATGFAHSLDTPWQTEMEALFPFQETVDQMRAIEDVKRDMESPHPMDRLVCGDVGFGKTEVAIRAAFKAVQSGKQVAVLVPTTLLAQQHFSTFSDRFTHYPIRVEVLSRFLTTGQAKKVLTGLADGSVDVVIGTHRLLSGDLTFKDLGLLVVDEEQRFGVTHKEAIKQLRHDVDVLTLTATPIPRTLEMSLTGIRDLTLLNTPPAERQPILTYVGEFDERAIAESIRRELLREGQVFYVHNRVESIEETARRLRDLVPEARIVVAHGQMDEGSLERAVLDFWEGQYDVMVCTTIIESGIDMPTVNTLVVERSDLLGLGQLHQLRGRVGRAGQRAYAYLFFPPDRRLTEEAYERLRTIGEYTQLGSGFKIAMRDLQIRGAGNLLGGDQSGHIAAVGYDLYVQMVTEAVAELKGEPVREPAEIKLELPIDANLPTDYVAREDVRLEAYRRLATVTTAAEVRDIGAEWEDRFGPIPPRAQALLSVARLRAECVRIGVREVTVAKGRLIDGLPALVARIEPIELPTSKRIRLQRTQPKSVYKEDSGELQVPVTASSALADQLVALLVDLVPPADPATRGRATPNLA